ncbi:Hint domain-containing protein [Ancylobacter sonchi]|uniref:Hint domain-containing protein n=1 Tax=Ancylobacter sonchi TaxID=1937790 RepID=UPI001BD55F78|nr:Hint domain-containing protein [Ancylobacter sonchi]MBS7535814.1 Hint domain-containing protein [Ancylobacter sonchi]
MATYSTSYLYNVSFDTSTFTYSITGSAIISETLTSTTSEEYFYIDDNITIDGVNQYIYQGFHGNGVLVLFHGNYMLFSNDSDLSGPVTIETTRFVTCFAAGVRLATPNGERAVEDLAIGDLVLTASGEMRSIRWIGRQTIVPVFADPLTVYPIRIAAGSLDGVLPVRDLVLSPDHALFLDGVLVHAAALVNGTTIVRVKPEEGFTYYHVEVEDHALVLAEGVAAETFVDNVTRRRFDNYSEFEALYGVPAESIREMDLPRVKSARQLPATMRARLEARSTAAVDVAA